MKIERNYLSTFVLAALLALLVPTLAAALNTPVTVTQAGANSDLTNGKQTASTMTSWSSTPMTPTTPAAR